MSHTLYQVDAFTTDPFKGNPAAVCLLQGPEGDEWMQSLAAEMNLSETAFLLPEGDGWRLRWFTPTTEVDLCGHATLAGAMILFTTQPALRDDLIRFKTRSGDLLAKWSDGLVELNFPVMQYDPLQITPQIYSVFGFQPIGAVYSGSYYLFEAQDAAQVQNAHPDMAVLKKLPMPEVIITAKSMLPAYDFISRFFAPQLGINEDPVTGSAHCLLAPYWAKKLGKSDFHAFQASQRGGELHLQLIGERVLITGAATIILKGQLLV